MSWILGIVIDNTPWWLWLAVGIGLLAWTYSLWAPLWMAIPSTWRIAIIGAATAVLMYLAGRNSGAAGALQRAKEKEQARADDIREKGAEARAHADHDALSGGLRDDDGWRRDDG